MPKMTICRGCPASGKSTWAASQKKSLVVNRDAIRRELFNFGQWNEYKFTKEKEDKVTERQNEMIVQALGLGIDVIDDNTNLNKKYFNQTINQAVNLGFEVEIKEFFDVPLHVLIERNLNREFSVPESVIHDMFATQMEIQGRTIVPIEGLPECVIIDVDGTIADMGKGESWGRMPYDWAKVKNDRPKTNVCKAIKFMISTRVLNEKAPVPVFVSGRDGVCYDDTKEWIYQHLFPGYVSRDSVLLYMRTPNDQRADCIIKEELLRKHILPSFNVAFCIDDRNQMVDHWRALGLECWQVAAGRF